ncbi:MAG: type I methionyl aminopeptidase [Phycisphaerae bacterium]|nr:type I methionyl aminopeptidase [Phycisphaerae bacterium]
MAISIRSDNEIELMRDAGRIVGQVHDEIKKILKPGITTQFLSDLSDKIIQDNGAIALFRGVPNPPYPDFPSSICVSINEQVVHGIPSKRQLKDGDIISVDCGTKLKGYCGDAARTFLVGNVSDETKRLVEVTEQTLLIAVSAIKPGVYWSEIAKAMQAHAEKAGFAVVREYVGHGIGRKMHEDPKIPNYVDRHVLRNDFMLRKGMVLAIEPMVNLGSEKVRTLKDGWTVVTLDGKPSAHWEHTIAVTEKGSEILTLQ